MTPTIEQILTGIKAVPSTGVVNPVSGGLVVARYSDPNQRFVALLEIDRREDEGVEQFIEVYSSGSDTNTRIFGASGHLFDVETVDASGLLGVFWTGFSCMFRPSPEDETVCLATGYRNASDLTELLETRDLARLEDCPTGLFIFPVPTRGLESPHSLGIHEIVRHLLVAS